MVWECFSYPVNTGWGRPSSQCSHWSSGQRCQFTLPLNKPMAPNPGAAGMTIGTGAVWIDDSPTHNHPSIPTPPTQPIQPSRSILRKSTDSLSLQLNNSTSKENQFSALSQLHEQRQRQGNPQQDQQGVEGDDRQSLYGVPRQGFCRPLSSLADSVIIPSLQACSNRSRK